MTELSIYFSYGFFMVYDSADDNPVFDWTDAHVQQGFARSDTAVCFQSFVEFGDAEVRVFKTGYQRQPDHVRAIQVPIQFTSGSVGVEGPEDFGEGARLSIEAGAYLLTAGQTEDSRRIDLYFQATDSLHGRSSILLQDEELDPPSPLLERCPLISLFPD